MTSKPHAAGGSPARQISTRREDTVPDQAGEELYGVQLGGTTLWAANEALLATGLNNVRNSIEQNLARHLTIARPVLFKMIRGELVGQQCDDRLLGAVLGAVLRDGMADTLVCGSKFDRPYRVFAHVTQLVQLRRAIEIAKELLQHRNELAVRDLEAKIFGKRRYNTWSSANHILAHISYRGVVEPLEGGNYKLVKGLP